MFPNAKTHTSYNVCGEDACTRHLSRELGKEDNFHSRTSQYASHRLRVLSSQIVTYGPCILYAYLHEQDEAARRNDMQILRASGNLHLGKVRDA